MRYLVRAAFAFAAAFASIAPSAAHEYTDGQIQVLHPRTRATPPGASTAAGYMKIVNKSGAPIRFVGASSPIAQRVEIHQMSMDGGVMRMRPVAGGVAIPAKGQAEFKPGGMHLMLIGLKKQLVEENFEDLTLNFEGGVTVKIEFYVEGMGGEDDHGH
jgi:periplasmic copper chaperone A